MKKRLPIEKRIELAQRYAKGEQPNDLSKAFGVSVRQVYRIIAEEKGDTRSKDDKQVVVSFRAPEAEVKGYLDLVKVHGIQEKSSAFRSLVRMAQGLVELFPDRFEAFNRSAWLIRKEGQLLNQLAKAVHKGKLRLTDEDRHLLSKCLDANQRLHDDLRMILEEHKGRRGYTTAALNSQNEAAFDAE
ncbi:hypothetical protein PhaeoP24_04049 (plasmid) [Phaeobacter inhibens]|uniref:helix-turn-helix domain-containing protein n=1 Tax=Phaeobacter TaxID=302485 RepID=UPI000CA0E728|nr:MULTISPECIES: hypothetical protein [Phaeobacter]AUQ92607.1 hypothetical protein PhaeoP24_04049 [Phaeobacter inhibens]